MSQLRIYGMAECDVRGVPLDWLHCRTCNGLGGIPDPNGDVVVAATPGSGLNYRVRTCLTCAGQGSLRRAARVLAYWPKVDPRGWRDPAEPIRCEECGHPEAEEGDVTWVDPPYAVDVGYMETRARGERALMGGVEPTDYHSICWSPCDARCAHGVPVRVQPADQAGLEDCPWNHHKTGDWGADILARYAQPMAVEASWRQVDVRTLDWPHDLRVEQLVVLCTRCYAERRNGG